MPKKTSDFPARIDFFVTDEMRCQLIALGYFMGAGGEYSTPARNLLQGALKRYMGELSEKDKQEYKEIYSRVLIREGLSEVVRDI